MRKALGMLTVRSIAFCATAAKLHPSESQSSENVRWHRADAARRIIGAGRAPDRWSCRPWPPTRRRRAGSATTPACSGSGSASGAMSRSYFAEFWTDTKGFKMDLHSFIMYLDIEETDGTLYLSQIPSARSRSLKIIVNVNLVMLVVDIL